MHTCARTDACTHTHMHTHTLECALPRPPQPSQGSAASCARPVLLAMTASGNLLVYQAFDRGGPPSTRKARSGGSPCARADVDMLEASGAGGGLGEGAAQEARGGCAASPSKPPPLAGAGSSQALAYGLAFRRLPLDWASHQEAAQGSSIGGVMATRCVCVRAPHWGPGC